MNLKSQSESLFPAGVIISLSDWIIKFSFVLCVCFNAFEQQNVSKISLSPYCEFSVHTELNNGFVK